LLIAIEHFIAHGGDKGTRLTAPFLGKASSTWAAVKTPCSDPIVTNVPDPADSASSAVLLAVSRANPIVK
jgi:hypothetical protein